MIGFKWDRIIIFNHCSMTFLKLLKSIQIDRHFSKVGDKGGSRVVN